MAPTGNEANYLSTLPSQRSIWQRTLHRQGGFIPFPPDEVEQSLAARFEKQVALYPQSLAIKDATKSLSYTALNAAANRIAHALLALPSATGHIGLVLENGIPMITAIWAVLKAGRVFIALDPVFPQDQLVGMIEDCQSDIIITNQKNAALAQAVQPAESLVVNIDTLTTESPDENPQVDIAPTAPAYIVYTSGSTGRPKGIIHSHQGDLNSILHYTNAFHICAKDHMTLLHSCSFSSGIFDIFRALLNGASLFVWDFKTKGFAGLAEWLLEEKISFFHWVPTPFRYFVETCPPDLRFPDLRLLILGSEAVSWRDVAAYKQLTDPSCIMVNRLGATEAYTFCLFFMDHHIQPSDSTVPVGYEVPDKEIILYDENEQPITQPNQIGEIGVRSAYLALGYWQQPELTQKLFRPDHDGDKRIYMTGDLGRMDADGCLEYLGRKDFQVKIRGHRVELSEIELCLSDSGWLKDVLVMACQHRPDEQQLVAYVIPEHSAPSCTAAGLRAFLKGKLPDYMIPSSFVIIDAFPLSSTGKVDRNALARSTGTPLPETKTDATANPVSKPAPQPLHRPRNDFVRFTQQAIEQSIPHRFAAQVAKYPQRIALKTGDHEYTYEALNQYSNRIAQALLGALGSGQEPVVLLMEQSAQAVAAILAVLKAGKYYVPLDPFDPPARLTKLLEDIQATCILSNHDHFALASTLAHAPSKVLDIDRLDAGLSTDNPPLSLTPDSLAYIFYTSGSTGHPKGVMDNQRNVLHNIMRYTNSLHISKDDRLSLLQSPNFSGTVSSLFGALLNGATICPFNLRQEGPHRLADWLNESGITIYHSVPTIFRSFLGAGAHFPSIRLIRLEGDRASRLDAELYRQYFEPACLLVNGLGTTETGLCRQYFLNQQSDLVDNILPIGYPVTDMDIVLLDDDGQPLSADQTGEIAVKSPYLSLGYWQQPELTQASFRPDPQGGSARTYRTGDMGRLRPDGCLEYLGRKNFQLKIRGQKVEPAEVEQALLGLSFVREAAVMSREDQQGEAQLVGYLAVHPPAEPSVGEIRRLLAQQLPDALVPTSYVFVDKLPQTPAGKIDRRALLTQTPRPTPEQRSYTPPHTPTEKKLALIWRDLLAADPVGLDDRFFDLGGHSLLAAQLFARIEKEFGHRLALSTLFQAPTLRQLAALIGQESDSWSPLVTIEARGSKPPFFFVHAHTGHVIGYYELAQHLGPDQPFYGLQARGLDGQTPPMDNLAEMAAYYNRAIRTLQPHGPYHLGGWCFGGNLAYEMAQQLQAAGEEIALLVMVESAPPNYPRYKPGTTPLHRMAYRMATRFDAEWCRLQEMPQRQRSAYLFNRLRRLVEKLGVHIEKTSSIIFSKTNLPITYSQNHRQDLLEAAHQKAYTRHDFLPYSGSVLLIRAEQQPFGSLPDETLGWKELLRGDLELHEVAGHNAGVLDEPRVGLVAELIANSLAQVR